MIESDCLERDSKREMMQQLAPHKKKASLSVRANSKFRHEKKVQADVGNSFGLSVAPNCQQFAKMAQHMPPSLRKSLSMPELPRKKKGHSRDQN